jgi:Zn-dependent alcohol dehydrogenase
MRPSVLVIRATFPDIAERRRGPQPHRRGGLHRARCGSDLHCDQPGGFGTVHIQEPMVLGHEVAGVVAEAGPDTPFAAAERVAISPSRPCGLCRDCQQGLQNHGLDMRHHGSPMRNPHGRGAFRQEPGHRHRSRATARAARRTSRR